MSFLNSLQFQKIKSLAKERNIKTYLIGGYVRDLIINPVKQATDIDIVCLGDGNSTILAKEYASAFGYRVDEAGKYGALKVNGPYEVDFVMARSESYERNSRQPNVKPGTLEQDMLRRDFTINSIALDIQHPVNPIDPFNGCKDIYNQWIRCVNDPVVTFSDDPLRIMRAIRFSGQLGFNIERTTYEGLITSLHRLSIISQERITTELVKILNQNNINGIGYLNNTELLKIIFPEIGELDFGGSGHKNNYDHTLIVCENAYKANTNYLFRLVALLHDIGKAKAFRNNGDVTFHMHEQIGAAMIKPIFERLKLPLGDELKYVHDMVYHHGRIANLCTHYESLTDSAIRRFIVECGPIVDDLFLFAKCDMSTSDQAKKQRIINKIELVEKRVKEFREKESLEKFKLAINGHDIMSAFEVNGKQVGEYKDAVFEAVMNGEIPNTVEASLEFLKKFDT